MGMRLTSYDKMKREPKKLSYMHLQGGTALHKVGFDETDDMLRSARLYMPKQRIQI